MSVLFSQLKLRGVTFRNRVFVSPMCQYSSPDGAVTDWHLVHLGSRAVGGAGLVLTEATAVSPEGRISPGDAGIWSDELAHRFGPIVTFIRSQGVAAGVQLAHAGRKASTAVPWLGGGTLADAAGGWRPLAPSAVPFADGDAAPAAMTAADLESVREQLSPRPGERRQSVSRSSSYTWRTGTCCTSSSPLCPTAATTVTAAASNGACASRSRSRPRSAGYGPRSGRCSCGSRPPTGRRAAGGRTTRSGSPASSKKPGSTSWTAPAAASSRPRRYRSGRDTRRRSRRGSGARPGWPRGRWG